MICAGNELREVNVPLNKSARPAQGSVKVHVD